MFPLKEKGEKNITSNTNASVLEDDVPNFFASGGVLVVIWPTFVFQLSTDIKTERMTKASVYHLVLLFSHPSQHWKMRLDLF